MNHVTVSLSVLAVAVSILAIGCSNKPNNGASANTAASTQDFAAKAKSLPPSQRSAYFNQNPGMAYRMMSQTGNSTQK
jgi:hypothetical protein